MNRSSVMILSTSFALLVASGSFGPHLRGQEPIPHEWPAGTRSALPGTGATILPLGPSRRFDDGRLPPETVSAGDRVLVDRLRSLGNGIAEVKFVRQVAAAGDDSEPAIVVTRAFEVRGSPAGIATAVRVVQAWNDHALTRLRVRAWLIESEDDAAATGDVELLDRAACEARFGREKDASVALAEASVIHAEKLVIWSGEKLRYVKDFEVGADGRVTEINGTIEEGVRIRFFATIEDPSTGRFVVDASVAIGSVVRPIPLFRTVLAGGAKAQVEVPELRESRCEAEGVGIVPARQVLRFPGLGRWPVVDGKTGARKAVDAYLFIDVLPPPAPNGRGTITAVTHGEGPFARSVVARLDAEPAPGPLDPALRQVRVQRGDAIVGALALRATWADPESRAAYALFEVIEGDARAGDRIR